MTPAAASRRIPALDAARAVGVVAMVVGHTLDALLAPSIRSHPAIVAYWKARGFTAPIFIAVAGWAVATAIQRSGALGVAIPLGRARRVALLFAVGALLHWPGWGWSALAAGDRTVFAHLTSFGVLHAIAGSMAVTTLLLALLPERRARLLALAAVGVLAVALGMRAPGDPASLAGVVLEQAIGGTSPFPLFPWLAYFAAGAAVGLSVEAMGRREGTRLALVGGVLVAATCWTGVGTMPSAHPILVVYRIGVFLSLIGALALVPAAVAARVAPLGRASFGVYALHVPLVYGWSTYPGLAARIGPRLGLVEALLVAGALLAAALLANRAIGGGLAWALRSLERLREAALRGLGDRGTA